MSKQMKKYCIIGKIVCDISVTILFFAVPMLAANIAGYIANLF